MKMAIGILIGLFLFPLIADLSSIKRNTPGFFIFPRYGIADVINGNCKDEMGENGHGWKFNVREYNDCNKVQIFFSDKIFKK